MSLENKYATSY